MLFPKVKTKPIRQYLSSPGSRQTGPGPGMICQKLCSLVSRWICRLFGRNSPSPTTKGKTRAGNWLTCLPSRTGSGVPPRMFIVDAENRKTPAKLSSASVPSADGVNAPVERGLEAQGNWSISGAIGVCVVTRESTRITRRRSSHLTPLAHLRLSALYPLGTRKSRRGRPSLLADRCSRRCPRLVERSRIVRPGCT